MNKRDWRELRALLVEILGSENVYYQPPSKEKLHYPAIIFERSDMGKINADNKLYLQNNRYTVTYIDPLQTDRVPYALLAIRGSSHDRHFTSDNLHHDVFTIYF